jgi:hypothetical protein
MSFPASNNPFFAAAPVPVSVVAAPVIVPTTVAAPVIVPTTVAMSAAVAVPKPAARRGLVDLPQYFVDLPQHEARKCLLKFDALNPDRVTHISTVLYSQVDPNNPSHIYDLDKAYLDFTRKIACYFGKPIYM